MVCRDESVLPDLGVCVGKGCRLKGKRFWHIDLKPVVKLLLCLHPILFVVGFVQGPRENHLLRRVKGTRLVI